MSHYKMIPVDPPGKAVELAEADSAQAFKIAEQLQASLIDVLRDDRYAFTLRYQPARGGYWTIFQRTDETIERLRGLRPHPVEVDTP